MKRLLVVGCLTLFVSLPANGSGKDWLPDGRLWETPIASPHQPKIELVFTNNNDDLTTETTVGGTFPIVRWDGPSAWELQFDMGAAVFSRFGDKFALNISDFLVEFPLSARKGPWTLRTSLGHTSSHLGDDVIEDLGFDGSSVDWNELTFAVSRQLDREMRVYGHAAWIFDNDNLPDADARAGAGFEWRGRTTGPYAAIDLDLRSYQDWEPNVTARAGWAWTKDSGRSIRLGAEGYSGKSPYGRFFDQDEDWFGLSMSFDW